jgi:4-amino-4-deoxy-L-arabinose transferase-like glycosyltransferase
MATNIRYLFLRPVVAITAVTLLTAALSLHRLGAADVCGANEAIEGVFVQQMVEHGHYLFPLENGGDPMYKPPLFHWTGVAIDRLLGITQVAAFNLRLPSALYATAAAALVMLLAYSTFGFEVAVLSGLILASSYQFISQARVGRVDMTLTFYETAELFTFLWWLQQRDTLCAPGAGRQRGVGADWIKYLLALSIGLAVLSKGPVGAILPLAAIAVFVLLERRLRDATALLTPGPVLLAVVISSSWYLACFLGRQMGFLHRQIGAENLGRFFGALGTMKFSYYLKPILLNSAPFSILIPFAVADAMYQWLRGTRSFDGAPTRAGREREKPPTAVVLFAIFWIVTIAFFWMAAYKRRAYLLPVWPSAAIMIGWWLGSLARTTAAGSVSAFIVRAAATLALAVIAFNFFYVPRHEIRQCGADSMRPAAEQILRVVGPDDPIYFYHGDVELASLIFYLRRDLPIIEGKLGEAPPGYVLVPAKSWPELKKDALDLEPVLSTGSGANGLILLHRGKAYARRERSPTQPKSRASTGSPLRASPDARNDRRARES